TNSFVLLFLNQNTPFCFHHNKVKATVGCFYPFLSIIIRLIGKVNDRPWGRGLIFMQKVTEFLVKRRYWFLAVMMVAAVICGLLAFRVPINTDMTKYLADSSPMKQGMD